MQPSSFHSSRGKAGRLGGQEGGRAGGREGAKAGGEGDSPCRPPNRISNGRLSRPCNTLRVRHRVKRIHAWLHRLCPLPRTEARTTAAKPGAVAVAVAASPSLVGDDACLHRKRPDRSTPRGWFCFASEIGWQNKTIKHPLEGQILVCEEFSAYTDRHFLPGAAARSHARCPSGGLSALRLLLA